MHVKFIETIDKLPLDIFFKCMVEKDYTGIVIEGVVAQDEIQKKWEMLFSQYLDIVGDEAFDFSLELIRDLNKRSAIIHTIELSIHLLGGQDSNIALQFLEGVGYYVGVGTRKQDLAHITEHIKAEKIDLKDMRVELEQLINRPASETISYEYFNKQLATLEIGLQLRFPIDPTTTTVLKYATWLTMLKQKINTDARYNQ